MVPSEHPSMSKVFFPYHNILRRCNKSLYYIYMYIKSIEKPQAQCGRLINAKFKGKISDVNAEPKKDIHVGLRPRIKMYLKGS